VRHNISRGVDGRSRDRNEWLDSRVVKHLRVNTGAKHTHPTIHSKGGGTMRSRLLAGKCSVWRLVISGIIAAALGASAAVHPAAAQSLISVDFGEGQRPLLFEGIEPQAAALDPLFAAADVWNELIGSVNFGAATTDPSFGPLVDSTGTTTAVSFAITGTISSFNSVTFFGRPNPDGSLSMRGDYIYFNDPPASNPSIDWRISGLTPGAVYRMVLYGANTNLNRVFTMLVDTDGDGDLTDEVAFEVITLNGATPAPAYLAVVVASASGAIVGRGSATIGEADWAGFQLALAPDVEMEFLSFKDSFLRPGFPDRNEGANPLLDLGEDRRLVVGFDLSGVDTSAVSRATLVLTINDEIPPGNWSPSGRFVDAHRLLVDWVEGNGGESTRGTGSGVTWNCAIDTAIENLEPNCAPRWNGGNFTATPTDSVSHTDGMTGEVAFDVTADIGAGADSWLLKKRQGNGHVRYYAKDHPDVETNPDLAPRLVLEFQ
jgi:hypothetical protein